MVLFIQNKLINLKQTIMNRNSVLVGVMLALTAQVGLSQQSSQPMSVKNCVEYSLKNSLSASVYSNQVSIATQQNREGVSNYLPQVNISGTMDDNLKRQVTVIPAGAFGPTDTKVQFGNQYTTSVTIQADQVLYDQSLITVLKGSRTGIELAQLKQVKNEDDIIYNTLVSYYKVLIYEEQIKLLSENEEKLQGLVDVQRLQYEKGVLKEADYKRVLVNFNNVKSQRELAETSKKMALSNLKNAMGMELEIPLVLSDTLALQNEIIRPSFSDFDISEKTDYKILETNILLQEIDLERKRAQMLPTLSMYARYGASAFGNEFAHTFDAWYDFSVVGLKLNVPVFSGLRRVSQIKQSELTLENTKQNLEINARNYKLQLQNANTQLMSSYTSVKANKENLDLANYVYENMELQYQKGVVGLTDFLNADYSKKEAQSNYINSLFNYVLAKIEIEQAKGTIKEFVNQL